MPLGIEGLISRPTQKDVWCIDREHREELEEGQEVDFTNFNEVEANWIRYEGDFQDDGKDGMGTIFFVDGSKYVGEFKDDMIDGKGSFFGVNGEVKNMEVEGQWS